MSNANEQIAEKCSKMGGSGVESEEAVGCGQARKLTSFNPRAGEVLAKYQQGYLQEQNASCYFRKNFEK